MAEKLKPDLCRDGSSRAKRSAAKTRHGHTKNRRYSPTYASWQSMLARVRYPNRDVDAKHVGRGISMAERWLIFDNFLADMGERPAGTTLDRINNDGDYEPGNCRWATPTEQARNRRNARLDFDSAVEIAVACLSGEKAAVVARRYGVSESTPRAIIKGHTWRDALAKAQAITAWNTRTEAPQQ